MEKIDKIMAETLAKKGLGKATQGALICFYAKEWGKDLFEPVSFSAGILKVSVDSSPAASELQMKENAIIDYLNQKINKRIIRGIRIVLKHPEY